MLKYIFVITLLTGKWECKTNQVASQKESETLAETGCAFLSLIEEPANFKGGIAAFQKYIVDSTFYPEIAYTNKSEGTARIQFTISTTGNVIIVTPLNELKDSLTEEAVRVIKASPEWNPAKQYGKAIEYRMVAQITFKWEPMEEEKTNNCSEDTSQSFPFCK